MNGSTPGLPLYHQLLEFSQTHVHWVSDAIQTSPPLLSPSPPALNLSQPGSFQMSQSFALGSQSIGVSASASVLPVNIQNWSLEWTGWISLQAKGLSRVFYNTTIQKHQFFGAQPSLWSNSHIHVWLLEKQTIALTVWTFVGKLMSLLFNMLSRFSIAFPSRSKDLLMSGLQSLSAVIVEPNKI